MTDEQQVTESQETSDLLAKVRDEMAEQISTMKSAFEAKLDKLNEANQKLTKENEDLQRAIVRSATVPSAPQEQPKSEEQIYSETVERCYKRTMGMIQ